MKSIIKKSLLITVLPLGAFAVGINNLDPVVNYNIGAGATVIDSDLAVVTTAGFNGQSLEVSLADMTSNDHINLISTPQASIVDGEISVVGGNLFLGDGTIASPIGAVDSVFQGNGNKLRLDFSIGFENGSFNTGSNGDTTISGWTVVNQQAILDGTTTIAGQPTPIDSTYPMPVAGSMEPVPTDGNGNPIPATDTGVASMTYTSTLQSGQVPDGSGLSVELTSDGNSVDGYAVIRGPYIVSNASVALAANDTLSFDWRAVGGSDSFDVFGYIVDVDTGHTEIILDRTGTSASEDTPWDGVAYTVQNPGNYKFVYISGTYDFTGGMALGGQLYVDNVVVTQANPATISSTNIEALLKKITYHNSASVPNIYDRALAITLSDDAPSSVTETTTLVRENHAPVSVAATHTIDQDTSKTFALSDFVMSDTDGDALVSITIVSLPSVGTLQLSGTNVTASQVIVPADIGNLVYTPVAGATGVVYASFDFSLSDGKLASNVSSVIINVAHVDTIPVATGVSLTGTMSSLSTLTGNYTYSDVDNDTEAGTTFKWYRSTDASGTGKTLISGATAQSYTLGAADVGKFISFEVTVANANASGVAVESAISITSVIANTVPVASNVNISGTFEVGQSLSGNYIYADAENDVESGTTFKWYRSNDASGTGKTLISGATAQSYTLVSADAGKFLSFEVTVSNVNSSGVAVESSINSTIVDSLPVTSNVSFTGTLEINATLTGTYTYNDTDGDVEAGTTFKWYESSDDAGSDKTEIVGAVSQTYMLTVAQDNKYISFEVTVANANGTGNTEESTINPEKVVDGTSIRVCIEKLYNTVLDREADTEGLDYWTTQLETAKIGGADLIRKFFSLQSFTDRNLDDATYVETLYLAVLNRQADTGSLNFWLSKLEEGVSRTDMLDKFLATQGFADRCAKYNVAPAHAGVVSYVERLYVELLGRDSEPEGLEYWTTRLVNGTLSASDIARKFLLSSGFTTTTSDDVVYLTKLYKTFLNREPDQGGLDYWLNKLSTGVTRNTVAEIFLGSQGFINLANSYSIRP